MLNEPVGESLTLAHAPRYLCGSRSVRTPHRLRATASRSAVAAGTQVATLRQDDGRNELQLSQYLQAHHSRDAFQLATAAMRQRPEVE